MQALETAPLTGVTPAESFCHGGNGITYEMNNRTEMHSNCGSGPGPGANRRILLVGEGAAPKTRVCAARLGALLVLAIVFGLSSRTARDCVDIDGGMCGAAGVERQSLSRGLQQSPSALNWTSCATGVWRGAQDRPLPYRLAGSVDGGTLGADYLPGFREGSLYHWGTAQTRHGQEPTPCDGGVKYEWESACAARHRVGAYPTTGRWDAAARAFCTQFDGAHVLFVGDSVQGQMFTSFLHLLGAHRGSVVDGGKCGFTGGSHEVLIRAAACSHFSTNVTAQFIRNDLLDYTVAAKEKWGGTKHLCSFADQAQMADLVVLNRGMHMMPTKQVAGELGALLANLVRARAARGLEPHSVIVRSTHASTWPCPLNATPTREPLTLPNHHYGWNMIAEQNDLVRVLSEKNGASFLDVFPMSSTRPGGC